MPDYQIIKTKYGITAGVIPPGLTTGELAVNIADAILFVGGTAGNAIPIVSGGGSGVGGFTYSSNPPASPTVGYRWLDADTGKEYVYIFDGTSNQWVQPMVDSIAGATGATGATGPVGDFVQSFNGLTGAVGLSAGSGISIATSGNTLTVSNTGVLSINGSTGSITNVARINEGNTFAVTQVMNAGITSTNLFVSGGATFNSTITLVDGTTQNTAWSNRIGGGGSPKLSPGDGNFVVLPDGVYATTVASTCRFGPTGSVMMNLSPFTFNRGVTLSTLYAYQASDSGNTGSFKFLVYEPSQTTGLPYTLIYESNEINIVPSTVTTHTVSPNVSLRSGSYWIGLMFNIPSGKTLNTDRYNWGIISGMAAQWNAVNGNRFFNSGDFSHLRYRISGMTAPNPLTHGFTSSISNNTDPAIGFGTSETVGQQRTAFIGASVQ